MRGGDDANQLASGGRALLGGANFARKSMRLRKLDMRVAKPTRRGRHEFLCCDRGRQRNASPRKSKMQSPTASETGRADAIFETRAHREKAISAISAAVVHSAEAGGAAAAFWSQIFVRVRGHAEMICDRSKCMREKRRNSCVGDDASYQALLHRHRAPQIQRDNARQRHRRPRRIFFVQCPDACTPQRC